MADDRPRGITSPWRFGWADWKAVLKCCWSESSTDNVGILAAGVAFYGFLSLIPVLGSIVLVYGLIASPESVVDSFGSLARALPAEAARLISEQLLTVIHTSDGKKGFGLLVALALALFGARNGVSAIITALNVAYEEEEKRGLVRLNLLALGMTAVAVLVALLAIGAIAMLASLQALLPTAAPALLVLGKIASYLVLCLVGAIAAAALYRFGPSRHALPWIWLTPGALLAALGWVMLTLGFGFYVANFGNYGATYGALSAVVVLLTWLYLSAYILIIGAELNSECERHAGIGDMAKTASLELPPAPIAPVLHPIEQAPVRPIGIGSVLLAMALVWLAGD